MPRRMLVTEYSLLATARGYSPLQPRGRDGRWIDSLNVDNFSEFREGWMRLLRPDDWMSPKPENFDALDGYTASASRDMNRALRGQPTINHVSVAEDYNKRLSEFFDQFGVSLPTTELFRGVNWEAVGADSWSEGDLIQGSGWMSTSVDPDVSLKFGQGERVMRIKVPKGTKAVLGSEYDGEVVLHHDTVLRLLGFDGDGNYVMKVVSNEE